MFGKERNRFGDPPPVRLNRLVKFLMAMTIARPSGILALPGLQVGSHVFSLDIQAMDKVLYFTKLFLDSLKKAKYRYSDVNSILTSDQTQRFIIYATRARQWAALSALLPARKNSKLIEIQSKLSLLVKLFDKSASSETSERGLGPRRLLCPSA